MKISVDIETKVEVTEERTMSAVKIGISAWVLGRTLISRIESPTVTVPMPYQSLGLPKVSTIGAQSIFTVCGQTDRAMIVAMIATGICPWRSWKARVTVT